MATDPKLPRIPAIMWRVGAITAIGIRVTGIGWTFAPTIAVVRDGRADRIYEGFGEIPEVAIS